MAKVSVDGKRIGVTNIVEFPKIIYPPNQGSEINSESLVYRNGVFTIKVPGYYEVNINFYSTHSGGLQAELLINNRNGFLFGGRAGRASLNMSTIVKLNYGDHVNVKIRRGRSSTYADANNFSIRKID